ncbi:MAG: rubredoxin [Nanoarchaeota archaeon]
MAKYRCTVCDYIYDEETEDVKFSDLPQDWVCPDCGAGKDAFEIVE